MIVGLLWADQNMRDFDGQDRLLMSSERNSLFNILSRLSEADLKPIANNQYYLDLSLHQAKRDGVVIYQ